MSRKSADLFREFEGAPRRNALIIDERRFGSDHGFSEERVLFAAVHTTLGDLAAFTAGMRKLRDSLDAQKRDRAIKASDVFEGRLATNLRSVIAAPLLSSRITFWATSTPYLVNERRHRKHPAAQDVTTGRHIDGHETPVVEMISGDAAEAICNASGIDGPSLRLEVFVDRSKQNGLHDRDPDSFETFEILADSPALSAGVPVKMGAGSHRRLIAIAELTKPFGDWLLLADLAAHVWGRVPAAVDRIRHPGLLSAIEKIGTLDGKNLLVELHRQYQA
ncbi:MAG: hypothetical protein JST92_18515 [Deltaproteobacteria bacterium]|nr:hypothetical protein [Deltaproteobacteria bacterium]